ncbi:RNA polymerase sigma factor [Nannocystaceae bacterium ST9]
MHDEISSIRTPRSARSWSTWPTLGFAIEVPPVDRAIGTVAVSRRPQRSHAMDTPISTNFDSIFQSHWAYLQRAARQMGAPEQEIEDLIQDTLLIAYQQMPRFEQRSRLGTWLYSIMRNVLRNRRRGWGRYERKLIVYSGLLDEQATCVGDQVLANQVLEEFLAGLDDAKREVFVLAEVMGCTGREIGEMLEINHNTAVSRLRAARRAFAEWVEPEG